LAAAFLITICSGTAWTTERVRIYAFYTKSHEGLLNDWFLPSLGDRFDLVLEFHEQECDSGVFMSQGWNAAMLRKADLILRAIEENPGEIFVYSDVDVQFLDLHEAGVRELIGKRDMLIQQESPSWTVCPGFFIARANKRTRALWQQIKRELAVQQDKDDQRLLNMFLFRGGIAARIMNKLGVRKGPWYPNALRLKWQYLPQTFYSPGIQQGKVWRPGQALCLPRDMVLHHASWTLGVENKIAQLDYVRELLREEKP